MENKYFYYNSLSILSATKLEYKQLSKFFDAIFRLYSFLIIICILNRKFVQGFVITYNSIKRTAPEIEGFAGLMK